MYTIIRRKHNNSIVEGGLTAEIDFAAYENDNCELRDCYYLQCFDSESEFEAEYYKTKPTGGPLEMEGITLVFGDKDAWVAKVRRLRKVENRESREITTTHLDALYDVMLNGVVIGHYSVGPEYGGGLLGTYDIMGASGVISFTKYYDDGRLFGYANVDPDTPARYYRNL
jgi:hypothetical protein